MSGNYDSEELLDGSSKENSAGEASGEEGSVFVNRVDSVNQVDRIDQDDGVLVMGADSVQDEQNEEKVAEDGAKDDMFVDCPDELVSYDRVSIADNSEAAEASEHQQGYEGYNEIRENRFDESENERHGEVLADELEHLRTMLEKTVGDKESIAREYEAGRRSLAQGLANLHYQLSALNTEQLVNANDGELVNHYESEIWEGEKAVVSDIQLQDMIYDCSKFVKHALDERSQTQAAINEFHTVLHKKDQEIQDLSAGIIKSSAQHDVEVTANRVLSCLASATNQEELFDETLTQKMCRIENTTLSLIEKYNGYLSETNLLRQCITNVRLDQIAQDEMWSVFPMVREELLELRRKEVELTQKVMDLEEEHWKQIEEVKKGRQIANTANAEIEKLKLELEHEKARYNNTKEKLSLAVTKGKALVQHRDSLKQSLADKTNELEKCLIEIQGKASALEAAELCKQELIKSENLAASLQEALSERNTTIENCERVLFESDLPEELQSMDIVERVQWLANESTKLMSISHEFQKLTNTLSSIDFPENMPSTNMESRVSWLAESLIQSKQEAAKLKDATLTREAAHKEIEKLTALIIGETQEKHYLQEELADLRYRFDGIVEKEHHNSSEKEQIVRLLHEVSGIPMDGAEGLPSDTGFIIDRCFGKLKEQTKASIEPSHLEREIFERIQSLLYTRDQEAMLFEKILEDDLFNRSEMNKLVNKIAVVSQELHDLRDEKDSLQNTLSRSEEKATLLREKLSMAVKKGKGLVQERENLKQLLDRTKEAAHNEIDRLTASILTEAQEKNYLQEELEDLRYKYEGTVESERQISLEKNRLVRMLHEASGITSNDPDKLHSDTDSMIDHCFEKLREQTRVSTEFSHVGVELFEKIQGLLYTRNHEAILFEKILQEDMVDRSEVNRLENKILMFSQERHDLKDEKDTLQNELWRSEERASLLKEELSLAVKEGKELVQEWEDMKKLLDKTREAAHTEIDRLTLYILAETQEKEYLENEFKYLNYKYEEIVEKEHQISLEKNRVVRMLQEASGMALDDPEELHSDRNIIIDQCLGKLKEQTRVSVESSNVEEEMKESIRSLLYIRYFEAILFKTLLEEELLNKSEMNYLESKIVSISQELRDVKDEKDSLLNDLSRSEEKATLLREKLSMAVKKGKGLVQERENMKQLLDEKNASIQELKLEREQQELTLNDSRNEIHKLSIDADRIPNLEIDLNAVKEQRDQLEQFLAESNRMLQRLIESIESILLSDGSAVKEPAEKVQRLAEYVSECQAARAQSERELEMIKAEAVTMSNDLALAEKKISVLVNEKEDAQVGRASAELELQRAKEEASCLTSGLAEAHSTIKSLEDAMSQVQMNLSLLAEENNMTQVGRTNLEREIEKLKEEAGLQVRKLADASSTIKSYEEAICKAENTISDLRGDKEYSAQEILDLKSRLSLCMQELGNKESAELEITNLKSQLHACMNELAGIHSTGGIRSAELSDYLNSLQLLLKDETLLSILRQRFEKEIEGLKDIDQVLKDIRDRFTAMDTNMQRSLPASEEDSFARNYFPAGLHDFENTEIVNGELDTADDEKFTQFIGKAVDNLQLKNMFLANIFESSFSLVDDLVASLSKKLVATRDTLIVVLERMKVFEQHMNSLELDKQAQVNALEMVENNIATLLSACSDATLVLKAEDENSLLESGPVPEKGNFNSSLSSDVRTVGADANVEHQIKLASSKYVKTANELLSGAKTVQKLVKHFQYVGTTVENLQSNLKESRSAVEKVVEEKDFYQSRVSKLEADLEALESMCSDMRHKLEEHQAKEGKWKEREAELMSLYSMSMKEKETENPLLSASQLKSLFKKIDGIEIPIAESEVDELDPHDSDHIKKLYYVIDCLDGLQRKIASVSHNNELQQSILKDQAIEIKHLKEEVSKHIIDKQDYEKMKHELFELAKGVENIFQKLGGEKMVGTHKPADVVGQLPILEKLVTAIILESENSKSKAQELDTKMLRTQGLVDELSSKMKLFEESKQGREASVDSIQERGGLEAQNLPSRSEISEIEEGPLVNLPIPPAPSNAHVRTLRKGSNDHLAINIDSESDRLISKKDTGEDKGHVFKPLNTSGLVPKQGRTIADRIDGIWVSGDRALMSRPRARIGVIVYWLFLNLWLLGTIL